MLPYEEPIPVHQYETLFIDSSNPVPTSANMNIQPDILKTSPNYTLPTDNRKATVKPNGE
jgi:hypothetical protein